MLLADTSVPELAERTGILNIVAFVPLARKIEKFNQSLGGSLVVVGYFDERNQHRDYSPAPTYRWAMFNQHLRCSRFAIPPSHQPISKRVQKHSDATRSRLEHGSSSLMRMCSVFALLPHRRPTGCWKLSLRILPVSDTLRLANAVCRTKFSRLHVISHKRNLK